MCTPRLERWSQFVTLCAVLLCSLPAAADNKARIRAIKALYKETAAGIKAKTYKAHTVGVSVMVAGIGPQGRDVTFHRRPDGSLARASTFYNVAASGHYWTNYLYDRGGKLAFCYVRSEASGQCGDYFEPVKSQERLYYATDGALVRYLLKRVPDADVTAADLKGKKCAHQLVANRRADRKFTAAEKKTATARQASAGFIMGLFKLVQKGQAKAVKRKLRPSAVLRHF
jgi:hypothetical protein